jgi:hypothetical protein
MIGSGRARKALLVGLCGAGLALAIAGERASVERANRLHREGELVTAATLYRERVIADTAAARLRYNLGTTLLVLGSPAAEPELARASRADDADLRGRALYNLGAWNLDRALDAAAPDSVREYAASAVEANKEALRLRPGRPDARWNLALAQRMLDSIDSADGRAGTESVDGSAESDQLVLSDELREFEDATDVSNAPRQGADEAPADSEDAGPLSLVEAAQILGANRLDASVIIGKLLTFEGRMRRPVRGATATPRW